MKKKSSSWLQTALDNLFFHRVEDFENFDATVLNFCRKKIAIANLSLIFFCNFEFFGKLNVFFSLGWSTTMTTTTSTTTATTTSTTWISYLRSRFRYLVLRNSFRSFCFDFSGLDRFSRRTCLPGPEQRTDVRAKPTSSSSSSTSLSASTSASATHRQWERNALIENTLGGERGSSLLSHLVSLGSSALPAVSRTKISKRNRI